MSGDSPTSRSGQIKNAHTATFKKVLTITIKDQFKKETDWLTSYFIIALVDVPTEWISALVVTTKKNGKISSALILSHSVKP